MRFLKYIGVCLIAIGIFSVSFVPVRGNIFNFDSLGDQENSKHKGTKLNYSINGDFGIRFSLVDKVKGTKIGRSVDYFKMKDGRKEGSILHSAHAKNKIEYAREGFRKNEFIKTKYLAGAGGYAYHEPKLWNVIYSKFGKKAERDEIKQWLNAEKQIRGLASKMGVSFDQFDLSKNRLIIEPIFYFTLKGEHYALTAHEIALLDEAMGGAIRKKHVTRSHRNIPLSLILKKDRFGFEKYTGNIKVCDNETIKAKLGIGVIGGKSPETLVEEPKIEGFDYIYRSDTEVYTTVDITPSVDCTPDHPLTVSFQIPTVGIYEAQEVYVPKGFTQSVWVKWRTPKDPLELDIQVKSSHGGEKVVRVKIMNKLPWEPQNPRADDKRPNSPSEFRQGALTKDSPLTAMNPKESLKWSRWDYLEYHPYGDFVGWDAVPNYAYDEKNNLYIASYSYTDLWDMNPYWSFGKHEYKTSTATDGSSVTHIVNGRIPGEPKYYSVTADELRMKIEPGDTCSVQNAFSNCIKSGYGVEAEINVSLRGNGVHDATGFQTAKYFFPEFNYKKYWRIGERMESESLIQHKKEKLSLPKNWYSYTGFNHLNEGRYHFLPVWYPDGTYRIYANVYDCWTPAGELRVPVEGEILCKGSLWEDWHVKVEH